MNIFQNKFYKKPTAFILIVSIVCLAVGPVLFLPQRAQAVGAAGCPVIDISNTAVGKAQLGSYAKQSIIEKIWEATTDVPTMIAAIATAAKDAWDKKYDFMKWAGNVMLNMLLHQILSMITNDIVNWIENGTTPRFLTEGIGDYLKEAVDNAAGNFVSQFLGAGWLCEPFDLDIKIALLDVPTFETEAECSISDIVDNIGNFYDDFSKGGWKGWIELSKPQNTFYGAYLLAQDKKTEAEEEAKEENMTDAEAGKGFLSIKDCRWYDKTGKEVAEQKNVRGTPKLPDVCNPKFNPGLEGITPPCKPKCKTKTPAAIVNELANEAVTDFQKTIRLQIAAATAGAGPFQVYVQAIAHALVNRTMKEGFLLLTGKPEEHVPIAGYGDIGATKNIPKIINPEEIIQSKDDALALSAQIDLLGKNLKDELLAEQKENLAILKLVPPVYTDTLDILNQISLDWPAGCSNTPYFIGHTSWAESQKDEIENHLIPFTNGQIDQLENVEIPKTIAAINEINTALVSIQVFINKADLWLAVYEQVNGQQDSLELSAAETEMNGAENQVIADTQIALETINGVVSSVDITGLVKEAQSAVANILYEAQALIEHRGMAIWPDPGTLHANLEAAQDKKDEADEKLDTCISWIPPEEYYW